MRQVFISVYRLVESHVGIFDPALCTIAPLTFSLIHVPPLPPPVSKYSIYRQVCGWEGVVGCIVVLETIFCRSLPHSVSDQIRYLQNCQTTPNKT
jgi:hypothetical protein